MRIHNQAAEPALIEYWPMNERIGGPAVEALSGTDLRTACSITYPRAMVVSK